MHSERSKLHRVLDTLNATSLNNLFSNDFYFQNNRNVTPTLVFDLTLEEPGLSSVSVTDGIRLVSEDEICCWRALNISMALSILGVITSVMFDS